MKATTNGKTRIRVKHHTKLGNGYNMHRDLDSIKKAFYSASKNAKNKAKHIFTKQVGQALDKTKDVKVNVAHYAKAQPFKTIGIAMLTGLCLGFLMRK